MKVVLIKLIKSKQFICWLLCSSLLWVLLPKYSIHLDKDKDKANKNPGFDAFTLDSYYEERRPIFHLEDYVPISNRNENKSIVWRKDQYRGTHWKTKQTFGDSCSLNISLRDFTESDVHHGQIFFLETSGKSKLNPRQACSIESAAKYSRLHAQVLIWSDHLDLSDNSTCYLYHMVDNVSFYRLNPHSILGGTPVSHVMEKLKYSPFKTDHLSDLTRYALLYKYGGFYNDLDTVTLRSLKNFTNTIGAIVWKGVGFPYAMLASGQFCVHPQHPVPYKMMQLMAERLKGKYREEIGPNLLTETIFKLYNVSNIFSVVSPEMTVLPTDIFYPVTAEWPYPLWPKEPQKGSDWVKLFSNSSQVHFFGYMTVQWMVTGDVAHEAYSFLGPQFCPISFSSSSEF